MADAHKNFAYSLVAVAPIPATSGTALTVTTGDGTLFPTPPFNATVWPAGANALSTNAEIVRVTAIVGDVLTITRTQESTSARTIVTGDQIADTITAATLQQYVASVVAGTDIGVDNTDPTNPIISTATPLSTLVPYTGATVDVDLGVNKLITSEIDSTSGSLYIVQTGGISQNPRLTLGQTQLYFDFATAPADNTSGGTINFTSGNGAGVSAGAGDAIGGDINFTAGSALVGDNNGGSVVLSAGTGSGTGLGGSAALVGATGGDARVGTGGSDTMIIVKGAGITTYQFSTGFQILFSPPTLTANRTQTYQDRDGIIALTTSPYAAGSFTVTDGKYAIMSKELILTSTEQVFLDGTARLTIIN